MKKIDLLKLLENVNDDMDINGTILETDEFKGLKDLSKLTTDDFKKMDADNAEYRGYIQSKIDNAVRQGVETFKNGKMQDEIRKAVEDAKNEKKSPEQLEIEKLKKQFEDSQAELAKERAMSKLSKTLKDKKLPVELANFAYGDGTEENINQNINTLEAILNTAVSDGIKAKLGEGSYTPPSGETNRELNTQIAAAMGVTN